MKHKNKTCVNFADIIAVQSVKQSYSSSVLVKHRTPRTPGLAEKQVYDTKHLSSPKRA